MDHIMRFHDVTNKPLANKHYVIAVVIDIEKVYVMMCKDVLLLKLLKMGIRGNLFTFFCSFLSNCSFQVYVGFSLFMIRHTATGIPQGSILSLILFSNVGNDLPDYIQTPAGLNADTFAF